MTYKQFILTYFDEIGQLNPIQSGRVFIENNNDITCAEGEIDINAILQKSSHDIYKSLPQ